MGSEIVAGGVVGGGSTTIAEFHVGIKIVAGCMARRDREAKMDNSIGTALRSCLTSLALFAAWCNAAVALASSAF